LMKSDTKVTLFIRGAWYAESVYPLPEKDQ
jgi:hypothetical protein